MKNNPLPRLDENTELRQQLLPFCRLKSGEVWQDPLGRHRVGCLDAGDAKQVAQLMERATANLAIHDPPIIWLLLKNAP